MCNPLWQAVRSKARWASLSALLAAALLHVLLHTFVSLASHPVPLETHQARPSPLPRPLLQLAGKNSHHIVEATFKAFARALRQACETDPRRAGQVASSKGVLTQQ